MDFSAYQLELLLSYNSCTHRSERCILMATEVHPLSHTDLFLSTGVGGESSMVPIGPLFLKRHLEKERSGWMNCNLLAAASSGLRLIVILSVHYALTVLQGHHKWGCKAALLAIQLALTYSVNPSVN